MPYDVLRSEVKYRGRIVDIKVDEISLPDGRAAKREVVLRGRAAAVIPIGNDGKVTLVSQYRHGSGQMMLEIPAGMVEEGENIEKCAVRELEEETGLVAGKIQKLIDYHVSAGYCTEIISIYLATELTEGKQNFDSDEFLELEEYSIDELVSRIMAGDITDSKTIIGILMAKEFLAGCDTACRCVNVQAVL